jgi:hypothetical protein
MWHVRGESASDPLGRLPLMLRVKPLVRAPVHVLGVSPRRLMADAEREQRQRWLGTADVDEHHPERALTRVAWTQRQVQLQAAREPRPLRSFSHARL